MFRVYKSISDFSIVFIYFENGLEIIQLKFVVKSAVILLVFQNGRILFRNKNLEKSVVLDF